MNGPAGGWRRGLACICVGLGVTLLIVGETNVCRAQETLDDSRREEKPSSSESYVEPPLADDARDHWAFRPLAPVELPVVRDATWAQVGLDRFLQGRQEREGLVPLPPAARHVWWRRASYDLRGLPPELEELTELEEEAGVDGPSRAVDRWLASPRFGERWSRPWLDLARFAETDGFEHDLVRPEAWRYRDWVVDAWNQDMSFDQFVRWQIAGDLVAPGEPAAAIATGFLLCGPDMPDLNRQDERRHMVLNEMTGTLGAVFLGLQLGCAECHDHKYDPLSLADFYRLRACFESTDLFRDHPLGRNDTRLESDRPPYLRASAGAAEWRGRSLKETQQASTSARWYVRGDYRRPGGSVEPAAPRVLSSESRWKSAEEVPARRKLADWLAGDSQPIVDRVAVNRLWQELFGAGLVTTPSDFGQLGSAPSHPELLDWLVHRWRQQGRSPKRWIRDVMLSAAYGQASGIATVEGESKWSAERRDALAANLRLARKLDAHNRWLVGQNRKRGSWYRRCSRDSGRCRRERPTTGARASICSCVAICPTPGWRPSIAGTRPLRARCGCERQPPPRRSRCGTRSSPGLVPIRSRVGC